MQDINLEESVKDITRYAELYGNVSKAMKHATWKIGTEVDPVAHMTYRAMGKIYRKCLIVPTSAGGRHLQATHDFLIAHLSQLMQTHTR